MKLWTSLKSLFARRRLEREMSEEIRSHIDGLTERNIAKGMAPQEAHYAALREFGGVEQVKERCRDQWGWIWLEQVMNDFDYAVRQLRKAPGFTFVAVLTLAVGIGACTTIFSAAYGVLLRPLPYPHSEQLVVPFERSQSTRRPMGVAPATYLQWREKATDFASVALWTYRSYNVSGAGESFRIFASTVTANYFDTLGIQPALGRGFGPDEDAPGESHVLILAYRTWLSDFGGDPQVIGRSVQLDKTPHTIIGVLPASFQLQPNVGAYVPLTLTAKSHADYERRYMALGRLKSGRSIDQAATQLGTISGQLARSSLADYRGIGASVRSLHDTMTQGAEPILLLLLGAVGCLLLIACTDIANLQLARASARRAEIAVRAALGASRKRIVQQLLVESLLIAVGGGLLGIFIGYFGVDILRSLLPAGMPHLAQIRVDGRMIAFASGLAVLTGMGFGLVPALRASRVNLEAAIKEGARRSASGGWATQRLRNHLVVAQVALALILLAGAGLFFRSLVKAQQNNVGFETKTTYLTPILFSADKYPTPRQRLNLINQLSDKMARSHGIEAVAFTNHTNPDSVGPFARYSIAGRAKGSPDRAPRVIYYGVTEDYFKTLRIPLVRGRLFTDRDTLGSTRVVLISRMLAQTAFAGKDPIGQTIVLHHGRTEDAREIVGVVGNTQVGGEMGPIIPQLYEPYAQSPGLSTTLVVRTNGKPLDLKALNSALHSVDPDAPTVAMFNLEEGLDTAGRVYRIIVGLFSVFSFAALALAAMGIYGVMTYYVTQRTGEIGIRMALGAQARDVTKLVLRRSARLVLTGMAIGLVGALGLTQLLRSQLYHTSPTDLPTFVLITVILLGVAMLACWLPARRATEVDPMEALRCE